MNKIVRGICLIFSLCLPCASPLFAQDDTANLQDTLRWWQVEMIVFTQGNAVPSSEVWPTDIELQYPSAWQSLIPLPEDNIAELDNPELTPPAANEPNADVITEVETPLNPDEIRLLPAEELQLTEYRNKIANNRNHRILLHGAWRQFMEKNRPEAPVIITGGDQYDDHFELEGSVHIYWQRYLHVDVNLWLSEFSINTGQERLPWPTLPKRPNVVVPNFQLGQPGSEQLGTNTQAEPSLSQLDRPSNDPLLAGVQGSNTPFRSNGSINTLDWFDQRGDTTFYDSRYNEILSRNYVVNQVVLNKQKGKNMRSNELHYIDHPKFGILVIITHYQPPEPKPSPADVLLEEILGPTPN